jgi:hypothetical protein
VTHDEEVKRIEEVALFRYGLIADLVHLTPGTKGLHRLLLKKADGDYVIPGTTRSQVAAETMRDWLKEYRKSGFDGLKPKPRKDLGESRALPKEVADLLVSIKDDNPGTVGAARHQGGARLEAGAGGAAVGPDDGAPGC